MPKITREYVWQRDDPQAYECADVCLDDAQTWCLHFAVPDAADVPTALVALEHPQLTGEYLVDGSWSAWGEERDGDATHVAVYFRAFSREDTGHVGISLARQAYLTAVVNDAFIVSTAGDYAEQLPPFTIHSFD